MAIPADPTTTSIITAGMAEAGQRNVSAIQISNFYTRSFDTIKTMIWGVAQHDKFLQAEVTVLASPSFASLSLPSDFDHEVNLRLYYGNEADRGRAQDGTTAFIRLASDFSDTSSSLPGHYVFTVGGTGNGQARTISQYDDTTKVATVSPVWTTAPASDTNYLIGRKWDDLDRDDQTNPVDAQRSVEYRMLERTAEVWPVPDVVYPVRLTYQANLTRIDDAGVVFVRHLRERRALWVAGVKYHTAVTFDDDRQDTFRAEFKDALLIHSGRNPVMVQTRGYR